MLKTNSEISPQNLRFPGSIFCELSALWLNLKYKLQQQIFHFRPTNIHRAAQENKHRNNVLKGEKVHSPNGTVPNI
jgi:hypothetical protein